MIIPKLKDLFDFNNGCTLVKDRYYAPLSKGVAYCAGVGANIEYESFLARQGYRVVYIDPSPVGIETRDKYGLMPFFEHGLAGMNGCVDFAEPLDPKERSYGKGEGTKFYCFTVKTLMGIRGDRDLAILKMNIEGFEYEVLSKMIEEQVFPHQICVSFHDHWQGIPTWKTIQCVRMLKKAGYKAVAKKRSAWTFVLKSRSSSSVAWPTERYASARA